MEADGKFSACVLKEGGRRDWRRPCTGGLNLTSPAAKHGLTASARSQEQGLGFPRGLESLERERGLPMP